MPNVPVVLSTLLLAGCVSDFVTQTKLPSTRPAFYYYADCDGDGWGNPSDTNTPIYATDPPEVGEELVAFCSSVGVGDTSTAVYATNNLDCDDSDLPSEVPVTGLIGSMCPADWFVQPGGTQVDYAVDTLGNRELTAWYGDSGLTWGANAALVCGTTGWGGQIPDDAGADAPGLITLKSNTEFNAVIALLDKQLTGDQVYAGWIGLVYEPDTDTANGRWVWEGEGSNLDPSSDLDYCNATEPEGSGPEGGRDRLALVKRGSEGWCIGFPTDASPEAQDTDTDVSPGYSLFAAHFLCTRERPDPADYAVFPSGD